MKLCEFLRAYRAKNNLTQEQLAYQCQVAKATIAKLEKPDNQKRPSMKVFKRLMAYIPIREDAFWSIITEDPIFASLNFAERWENFQAEENDALFRKLNWKGQNIALTQLRILATTDELLK